ncbi:RNA-binding protein [Histomonas meleagridis]|uniref:RNA-binding protein n=1 Tax=Histomonas meleagridis TaxID=135588 RepID=UPI0035593F36|nr:RNA-binding protein [Histomonas meleagridis]KAH0805099.1 RNA-binding protein [Histomonas meleagridis]
MQKTQPNTLFVRNIQYTATADQLSAVFEKYGKIKKAKILTENYHGQPVPRGIGFVEFEDEEGAKKALEDKSELKLGNRVLHISQAKVNEAKRDTIFVGGIPEGTTIKDLLDTFAKYNAKNATIICFDNGPRKGYAFVQLGSSEDREAAMKEGTFNLNGTNPILRNARHDYENPNLRSFGGQRIRQ